MLVKNKSAIQHMLVLMIPGIETSDFNLEASGVFNTGNQNNMPLPLSTSSTELPHMHTVFRHIVPTRAPGDKTKIHSPISALMQVPLTDADKKARAERNKEAMLSMNGTTGASQYLMDASDMKDAEYPLPSYFANAEPLAEGWIETAEGTGTPTKVYGMDCEMCLTSEGSQLARITIVSAEGKTIYDELIKPVLPITDYLTSYSGMTAERVATAATSFRKAQKQLKKIIDYDTILVGHSLECDLRVLKLAHPHVIDTSSIYQHTRGPPYKPSLKWLTQKWLARDIQNGTTGHDSHEDAKACLDLLAMKLSKGPDFGTFASDTESLFSRLARQQPAVRSAVIDWGNPQAWHGNAADTCVGCKSDEDVVNGIGETIQSHGFVWARLREMEFASGWNNQKEEPLEDSDRSEAMQELNRHFGMIWESLPRSTTVVVFSGSGNPKEMSTLNAKRNRFNALWKSVPMSTIAKEDIWTEEDQKGLEAAVDAARSGWSAYRVK